MAASSAVGYRVGEQGKLPTALDGLGHHPLVVGAVAADPPGDDLPTLGEEELQRGRILVIDHRGAIGAEPANLLAAKAAAAAEDRGGRPGLTGRGLGHVRLLLGSRLASEDVVLRHARRSLGGFLLGVFLGLLVRSVLGSVVVAGRRLRILV